MRYIWHVPKAYIIIIDDKNVLIKFDVSSLAYLLDCILLVLSKEVLYFRAA